MTATKDATTQKFAVELRKIDDVRPYERNPRLNDRAVDAVAASLAEFGWRQPIVVDEAGAIIVGHTRWKAARKLGLARVPVHVATDLTPEQVRAYRIADNKIGELADWDLEILPIELNELRAGGFDMDLLAFDVEELGKLLNIAEGVTEGLTDPDSIPEPPDDPITQRGDLWILGNHRLLCGDSASADDVDRLLAGSPVHLCNTDPPYGVRVEPRSNNAIAAGGSGLPHPEKNDKKRGKRTHHQSFDAARQGEKKRTTQKMRAKDRPLVNDFVSEEEFNRLLHAWFGQIARVLLPGRAAYIWGGYANCANYPPVLKSCGLYFSQAIIWVKEHPVLTRKDFMGNHEWCFYTWREGAAHVFLGPNNVPDVWSIKKVNPQSMVHLTEKPVELAIRAMQYSSRPGENVLDLFGGSGSTLIAAEQTERRAFLMELDQAYCDVICDRFQRFTGIPAVLQRTGDSPIPMKPREENMR
jgi:DNA modification methylase